MLALPQLFVRVREKVSVANTVAAAGLTVQVNVSVSVRGAVRDRDAHVVGAGRAGRERPADHARGRSDRHAGRQAGGAVGEPVGVRIGGVGVEADRCALGVGAVLQVGLKSGAVFCTVTGLEVTGALVASPSSAVTRTRIRSPLSPLPAVARFSVPPVAPPMSVPLRVHW